MPVSGMLVIGYGNTLRGDDGAGVRAAELIAMHYPNVHCMTVQQLTLDLAETIAQHAEVVFLDASIAVNKITVTALPTDPRAHTYDSHLLTPVTLVQASHHLYGHLPRRALQIEIPATDFAFGEHPSPKTMRCVEELAQDFHRIADSPLARWISARAS
jgi:hydrogenase maturation protease